MTVYSIECSREAGKPSWRYEGVGCCPRSTPDENFPTRSFNQHSDPCRQRLCTTI